MMTKLLRVLLLALTLLPALPADAETTFTVKENALVAEEDGAVRWKLEHSLVRETKLHGPVVLDGHVYYCLAASVYDVDAGTGIVGRRIYLPGQCRGLEADGAAVKVTAGSDELPQPWTGTWRIEASSHDVPFFLSSQGGSALQLRRDARHVLDALLERTPGAPKRGEGDDALRRPELAPFLEQAIPELERRGRLDPTNPWYSLFRARYLDALGKKEEARAALEAVFAVDPAYDLELLGMVPFMEKLELEAAARAWDRGIRFLLARDFEPELMGGLIGMMIFFGSAGDKKALDADRDLERLERFGTRLWDLAPLVEGGAAFYRALSEAHAGAGHAELAARWAERAELAAPYRFFGGASRVAERAGYAMTVMVAALASLVLVFLVKVLRNIGTATGTGAARWNLVGRWTRAEVVGLLLVYPVLLICTETAIRGVASIGVVASAPISVGMGNLGHPEAVAYWKKVSGTPGADFVRALAMHQAGDLEGAAALYAASPLPEAKVNLGVIRAAQGKADEARALYEAALEQQPGLGEAAFNLGRPADTPRADRARRFGLAGPLLAVPPVDAWSEAWVTRAMQGELPTPGQPFEYFGGVLDLASNLDGLGDFQGLGIFAALLLVPALIGLVRSRPAAPGFVPSRISRLGWALGFVVPGSARQLGIVGPLLLVVFISSGFFAWTLAHSGGEATHILEAIAIPNYQVYFGISSSVVGALSRWARMLAGGWWAIWAGNAVIVLLLERIWPDPAGLWYKRS